MAVCVACGAHLPDDARFCPACAAPVAAEAPVEERKLATVLFADLVGSTALADAEDPERTRAMLGRFYDAMSAEIERAGGTVEKFAGDAVMAVFGAPVALEDHAERALHAALAMRRRLDELFGDKLALRIGVNTGDVVAGRAREASSFVSGDAVNVAARLEQAAAAGEILVGARTAAAVGGAFELGEARTVEAKGKPGGVVGRSLQRALALMRPRGFAGIGATFVGRESELAELEAAYDSAVTTRRPRLVLVAGDSGIGKTRLAREFWARLAERAPEPLRRTGRCLSYGQGITYWPFGEMLREHFDVLESDPPERVLRRLGPREILGVTLGLDVAGGLHPLAARDRLHEGWVAFLSELSHERPVVLLVEDVHWAEPPLLELLERTASGVEGPLLVVATSRPELLDRWSWSPRVPAVQILLEALSETDAARMVNALPAELRPLVVETAEGNPFFVEEVVASLVDRGVLARADGGWVARELPPGFAVPDSVQAVLAARIDLLRPAEKAALQAAAVIGRVFWSGPVYELLEGFGPDLRILEEREFIRRRPGSALAGETEYAIKHALTREVAYASLPKARRARLHAAFARWIEREGGGRDEHVPLLAHHYAQAVRPDDADLAWAGSEPELAELRTRAIAWLRRAAELSASRYALDEALGLLDRALTLDPDRRTRAELWRAIARANALQYKGDGFWEAITRALEECDDPALEVELRAELAYETALRSGMWRSRPSRELVDGWIDLALASASPESTARAKALIARCYWNPMGPDAPRAAREATQIAERLDDPEIRSNAWGAHGVVDFARGEFDLGRAWAERRFEVLEQLSDPDLRADIYNAPISGCIWSGRFGEARRLARINDEITAKLTPHHRVHGVAILGETEELLGEWSRIRELEDRTVETVAENTETPCVRNARSLLVCALARHVAGEEDAARRLETLAAEHWMEGYGPMLDTPLLRIALVRGDVDEAERIVGRPEPTRGWYKGWMSLVTRVTRLDALAAIGQRDEVEAEAASLLRPGKYPEPFALRALGIVRDDDALIRRALERFEALGLRWHAEKTRAMIGKNADNERQ
jgi:class 3 adenylate cyclase